MNFPYHTESVSQHVDHFKQQKKMKKNVAEKSIIFREGVRGGGTPLQKIINLIFQTIPKRLKKKVTKKKNELIQKRICNY